MTTTTDDVTHLRALLADELDEVERLRAWEDAARRAWSIVTETAPEDCPGPDAVRAVVDKLDDDAIETLARIEKAEAERDAALAEVERLREWIDDPCSAGCPGDDGDCSGGCWRDAKQEAERNAMRVRAEKAEAACAEMRAAAVGVGGRCRLCTARPREHRDNCALSRPDLGAGVVVVPREVVESARDACAMRKWDPDYEKVAADLDALLGKGRG